MKIKQILLMTIISIFIVLTIILFISGISARGHELPDLAIERMIKMQVIRSNTSGVYFVWLGTVVENIGNDYADVSYTKIQINNLTRRSDAIINPIPRYVHTIPLAPGQRVAIASLFLLPSGYYEAVGYADGRFQIDEGNESNNDYKLLFNIP